LGAGVAFGVVGLVSSLNVNHLNNQYNATDSPMYNYRKDVGPKVTNVCNLDDVSAHGNRDMMGKLPQRPQEVTDACGKQKTPFTLQLVFYPVAAVAAGVGLFLVGTSGSAPKKPTSGFTVDPQVGLNGAKLNVAYTW